MLGKSPRSVRVRSNGRSRSGGGVGRRLRWLAVLPALLIAPAVQSASLIRGDVGPRLPTNIGPRSNPIDTVGPRFDPSFHTAPGGYGNGQVGGTGASGTGGASGGASTAGNSGGTGTTKSHVARHPRNSAPAGNALRSIPDEIVFELNGNRSNQQLIGLLNSLRLALLETRPIPLINTTFYRARILDGTSVPTKMRTAERTGAFRTLQPNYLFRTVQAAASAAAPAADPSQYAAAKLRLDEAHGLARGDNVPVAIIDSGIDVGHPELAGVVEKSFDALNAKDGPRSHGTAIAGIIAGHARLDGAAPAVRILAARAFSDAQGSTVSIITSVDWAAAQGARVINMSFAGPSDPALGRVLAGAHQKGVVLIAASGNAGPKSPPLWPAADPHVIAVTATDYADHLFPMANRGSHVAIAAPGVDVLVANAGGGYKLETGTSFSAAFVSGVAALVLERRPELTPDAVKKVLLGTAHDLGAKGRDDLFGAGLMDAYEAVNAVAKPADAALQVPVR